MTWQNWSSERNGFMKTKGYSFMMRCKSWKFHEIDSGQHQRCLAGTVGTNIQIPDSRVSCVLSLDMRHLRGPDHHPDKRVAQLDLWSIFCIFDNVTVALVCGQCTQGKKEIVCSNWCILAVISVSQTQCVTHRAPVRARKYVDNQINLNIRRWLACV